MDKAEIPTFDHELVEDESPATIEAADELSLKQRVRAEVDEVEDLVRSWSLDDLKGGGWFEKLLRHSLRQYTAKVDADYFRRKYPHLPPDAIADGRIKLAANYASIEGALSAAAYTGAVAVTIGSGGGASPLTLPAGGAAFVVDMTYTTQLQLKLAYDLAVIYGIPLDLEDPNDLWKLIRVAMTIKSGSSSADLALKGVPVVVRPVVKKVFSGSTLAAARSLPVVGKHLLQRHIVKFAIPGVTVPLTIAVNYWTTRVAGRHAQRTFRFEARILEAARRLVATTEHENELPWVMLMTMRADGPAAHEQSLLLHHVTSALAASGVASDTREDVRTVIDVDEDRVWSMVEAIPTSGAASRLYDAGVTTIAVTGTVSKAEQAHLERLAMMCGAKYEAKAVMAEAKGWKS